MCEKYLILLLIASIELSNFAETQSLRGPRDYGEELPITRSGIPKRKINGTSGSINTLELTPESREGDNSWEPLACTECLSERYLQHYLAKGCKPIDNGLFCKKSCPKHFECPKKKKDIIVQGCEYKGKIYKFGDRIKHDNPCKQGCFCNQNFDDKNISHPEMTCAAVDCFNNFKAPTPNCFQVWEEGKCCSKEKCLTDEELEQEIKCTYDGQEYHQGQNIFPTKIDPCLECVCDRNWNQTNPEKSCKRVKCDIKSDRRLQDGCIPIYHEGACCPIDYFCPPPKEEQCHFNGKIYLIGERLEINKERTECICKIPPEFTCIQKIAKQLKPKTSEPEDYIKKFQTLPKINLNKTSDIPFANIPDLNQESKCAPFIPGGLSCAGVNCTTIIDTNGCQACNCQKPCPKLKCGRNCSLVATTPGVCPRCQCS